MKFIVVWLDTNLEIRVERVAVFARGTLLIKKV